MTKKVLKCLFGLVALIGLICLVVKALDRTKTHEDDYEEFDDDFESGCNEDCDSCESKEECDTLYEPKEDTSNSKVTYVHVGDK